MPHGAGRTLPAGGGFRQVPTLDANTGQAWADNGARNVIKPTANQAVNFGDVAIVDATSGNVDLTLPTPTSADQAPITAKRQTGSNTLRLLGTVNGSTNLTVTTAVTVVTDGANWFTI